MSKTNKYLTIEQKRALALSGKDVPLCVGKTVSKNSFIDKIRGFIFDGSLKNRKFNI
ncbi:MAG: hypothetical protein LIO87_06795 [Eubacterium sp.]|nr:hypothetical protein [Eubacterium sp.]